MEGTGGIPESLRQRDKQLKIVVLSGVVIQKILEKCLEVGFIDDISNV